MSESVAVEPGHGRFGVPLPGHLGQAWAVRCPRTAQASLLRPAQTGVRRPGRCGEPVLANYSELTQPLEELGTV